MPKVQNLQLGMVYPGVPGVIDALGKLRGKPKRSDLGLKSRRMTREVLQAIQDREDVRQELLDQFGAKDDSGARITTKRDGAEVFVLADEAGFEAAWQELLLTEVEITEHFTPKDFDRQPDGFTIEDEFELLGALLVED